MNTAAPIIPDKSLRPIRHAHGLIWLGLIVLILVSQFIRPPIAFASPLPRIVSDVESLSHALKHAKPGQIIEVLPGTYRIPKRISLRGKGTADAPIILRSAVPAAAILRSSNVTLFKVFGSHWQFRGIDFQGLGSANHALHIVADAHNVVIEGNRFQNFHAAIKVNGEGSPRRFPDHGRITRNIFINDAPRKTNWPVVAIDIVGGIDWLISENFIADIAHAKHGRHGSTGFVKAGASDTVFDRNFVICEWRHRGGPRIGLSLGGGGSSPGAFDHRNLGDCTRNCPETINGRMTNNIVINCPHEPGIYLNRAAGGIVSNNTIFNAFGIQARFPETTITIADNLLTGTVWARDGATVTERNNIATGWLDEAAYIPSFKEHLAYRISDYDRLFPSWISKEMVRSAQRVIRSIANWTSKTIIGQRHDPFKHWFYAPEAGDMSIANEASTPFLASGSSPPIVTHDFCGTPRIGRSDIGAIQYSGGSCDLNQELIRRHGEFFTELAAF